MRLVLSKVKNKYKDSNAIDLTTTFIREFFNFLGLRIHTPVERRRAELSNRLIRLYGSAVIYGPLKGLILSEYSWWGRADRAAMIFGLYEEEVIQQIINKPEGYDTFVDLGAADGYYAVGLLKAKIFQNVFAFEINSQGRKNILSNAEQNGVQKNLHVLGEAKQDFYKHLSDREKEAAVILIDIEGAEYDLLSSEVFQSLSKAVFVVELHDFFFKDGFDKTQKLIERSSKTHRLSEVYMGQRNPSKCKELHSLSDSDRWLICSEGRGQLMRWLRFDPA